jgi:hypothetical protein
MVLAIGLIRFYNEILCPLCFKTIPIRGFPASEIKISIGCYERVDDYRLSRSYFEAFFDHSLYSIANFYLLGGLWGRNTHLLAVNMGIIDKPSRSQGVFPWIVVIVAIFDCLTGA